MYHHNPNPSLNLVIYRHTYIDCGWIVMEWSFMLLRWLISFCLYTVDFCNSMDCVFLLYATAAQIDGV